MLDQPTYHHHTAPSWMSKSQKVATYGELWTALALERHGYTCHLYPDFFEAGKDILIEGTLPCEVKTSTQGQITTRYKDKSYTYPYWKWRLRDVGNQDVLLVLLAVDVYGLHYPFVLPSAWLKGRSYFSISNHPTKYGGIIAPGLNNWAIVDYLLNQRYQDAGQLDLFVQAEGGQS